MPPSRRRARTVSKTARALVAAGALLCLAMLWALILAAAPSTTTRETTDADQAWNLILVNTDHPLPETWEINTVEMPGGECVDARIADSLTALLDDAESAGFHPFIRSGYRTRKQQRRILDERIAAYEEEGSSPDRARQEALTWVAQPGTSEHELGLAVDINDIYGDPGLYDWLREHAATYGFIQRYPENKVYITGISHEPWHYRYVGEQAAREMADAGLCLEEYLRA